MGAISRLGKIVLITINLLILILSLTMVICGVLVVSGHDLYKTILSSMTTSLESSLEGFGVAVETEEFSLTPMMLHMAYGLIAFGSIMVAISILGCMGGFCSSKLLLKAYIIGVAAPFLAQIIIVGCMYGSKSAFDDTAKPYFKAILNDYAGVEGTDVVTLAWNALMSYEECCGVDGYQDFEGKLKWPPMTVNGTEIDNLLTPIFCCKEKSTDYSCAMKGTASAENNWFETGCYDKLFSMVVDSPLVISLIGLMFFLQIILILASIWIVCTMDAKADFV